MSRKVLITGATGFVGSHLAKRLGSLGWEVHIAVRNESGVPADLVANRFTIHVCDSRGHSLHEILKTAKPDLVYHLASFFRAEHSINDIPHLIQSNIEFGTNLLEAMSMSGTLKLINTGSSWQHFLGESYRPVCLYAATKQAFESILTYYVDAVGLRVITLKLTDTYGPNDRRRKILNIIAEAAAKKIAINMSPGEQLLDLVFIDDVTEAYLVATDMLSAEEARQEDYLISSGELHSLKDIVRIYQEVTGRCVDVTWGGIPYRKREVMSPWVAGPRLPGWAPKISLQEGLKRIDQALNGDLV